MNQIRSSGLTKSSGKLSVAARTISIPIILFTLFMVLGHMIFPDTEAGTYPPIENLLPALMTVSVLGLALSWQYEVGGGVVTVILFIGHLIAYWYIREKSFPLPILLLFSPVLLDGILFIVSGIRRK